jgi:hypothetical protein
MKYKGLWSRWHRFDTEGNKYIQKFEIDQIPDPIQDAGYTEWRRGTGPLAPEHYKNVANALREMCKGKPKSPEQRQKMAEAKRGKPKSQAHKDAMSKTWQKKRQEKYQQIMQHMNKNNQKREAV